MDTHYFYSKIHDRQGRPGPLVVGQTHASLLVMMFAVFSRTLVVLLLQRRIEEFQTFFLMPIGTWDNFGQWRIYAPVHAFFRILEEASSYYGNHD